MKPAHFVHQPVIPIAIVFLAVAGLVVTATRLDGRAFSIGSVGSVGSVQFTVNTVAAALASTFGILMALVLLTVQLTAQRYSFNIVDTFLPSPINVGIILLFTVSIAYSLWISVVISDDYVPAIGTYVALILATLCFSLLIPYTMHVFNVLRPSNLLDTLRRDIIESAKLSARGGPVEAAHARASTRLENLGDVGRSAVNLADADTARRAIWAIHSTLREYLELKPQLPDNWFSAESRIVRGRHDAALQQLRESGLWIERRAAEELQDLFNAALLARMDDITHTVAQALRMVGEDAIEHNDRPLIKLVAKFFNTFLRATINRGEVRGGYDTLYEYELLAESALFRESDLAIEIAERLTYYGEAAGDRLMWMAAASAHDLRVLAEKNHRRGGDTLVTIRCIDLLHGMITRMRSRDPILARQLHKSAVALGCYFQSVSEVDLAPRVQRILQGIDESEIDHILADLLSVTEPEFWEVTERWVNFDFMDPTSRESLKAFLSRPVSV